MKVQFLIIESVFVKAGNHWNKCYQGTIMRGVGSKDTSKIWGQIDVDGATVLSTARDQWEFGNQLDLLVLMVLEMGLPSDAGESRLKDIICMN